MNFLNHYSKNTLLAWWLLSWVNICTLMFFWLGRGRALESFLRLAPTPWRAPRNPTSSQSYRESCAHNNKWLNWKKFYVLPTYCYVSNRWVSRQPAVAVILVCQSCGVSCCLLGSQALCDHAGECMITRQPLCANCTRQGTETYSRKVRSCCRLSLTPTAIATDPPLANSPTMHSRLVRKDPKHKKMWTHKDHWNSKNPKMSKGMPILAIPS